LPIIKIGGNKLKIINMTIDEVSYNYGFRDYQSWVNELFTKNVDFTPELKELRDWVEKNVFGFGERSFYWLWKLIVDEMPANFTFLEIGVFRGQTLALVKLLAKLAGKECICYGITPLDTTDGHWESNYASDIKLIHDTFKLPQPKIIVGLSTDLTIIDEAKYLSPMDIVYIDGGHSYDVVKSDMSNYPQLSSKFLVVDDCCNDILMPWGYFAGISSVTKAVNEWESEQKDFKLLFNVVHNKLYKRNAPDTNI